MMIEFTDSDASMIYKNMRNFNHSFIEIDNVRNVDARVLNVALSLSSNSKVIVHRINSYGLNIRILMKNKTLPY